MTDTPPTLADALVASVRELAAGAESNRLPTTPDRISSAMPSLRSSVCTPRCFLFLSAFMIA